jgi:protein dithiol oxidoreductase (disulfide-forming)
MNRRDFSSLVPQALALSALPIGIAQALSPKRIEVLAFFSYSCGHCRAFEPVLESWAAKLPVDVELRRVPVPFLANATILQKTFYALQSMGLGATLHTKVFSAVQEIRPRLGNAASVAAFLLDSAMVPAMASRDFVSAFAAVFDSFSVAMSVRRANQLSTELGINTGPGVPALVVGANGVFSAAQLGAEPKALAKVDTLIQRARGV